MGANDSRWWLQFIVTVYSNASGEWGCGAYADDLWF